MTIPSAITDPTAEAYCLIAVLEHHRQQLPFADQELARHQQLLDELEIQRRESDGALKAWRVALAQRWNLEVASQRLLKRIKVDLQAHYPSDDPCMRLVALIDDGAVRTADDLVNDLNYLVGGLGLITPPLALFKTRIREAEQLRSQLEAAIAACRVCEAQRRGSILGLRMASRAYRRVVERTRQLITTTLARELN